jgi:hypothetical protein
MLTGTWQLDSFYIEHYRSKARQPYFSDNPTGILFYDHSGHFSGQISSSDRPAFATNDPFGGTEAQFVACYKTYLAYFGRYEVNTEAGVVRHSVVGSLYPTWTNGIQVRSFVLSEANTRLMLATPPMRVEGQDVVSKLEWKRLS